jgi:GDP-fucose transporter C1
MIICNNLTLKYVEVSFYNVARSLTIVFNVAFTYFMLGSSTSRRVLAMLAVVIVGFFVGAEGEVNFSLLGTLFGIGSSAFVSLNSIYTRKVLPAVQDDKWALSAYNNANAVLIFLPIILMSGEVGAMWEHSDRLFSVMFWSAMMVSGIFGFLIGIATVLQIQTTSPLTHNISGTAKAAVQSIVAVQIWQNEMTANAWVGLFTVLGGSLGYAYIRKMEMDAAPSKKEVSEPAPVAAIAPRDADEEFGLADGTADAEAEKAGLLSKGEV